MNVALLSVFAVAGCEKVPENAGNPDAPVPQAQLDKLAGSQKSADELCYQIRYSDDPKKIVEMIEAGADISGIDHNGFTPLITAVLPGSGGSEEAQAKIVDLLLARGADPSLGCPLCAVAQSSKPALAKKLLDKGADINGKDPNGRTPLMAAVDAQSIEMVTFLLDRGANADVKESNGRNAWLLAFHKAYSFPSVDTMKVEELLRGRTNRVDIEILMRGDSSLKDSVDVEKWLKTHP
jgi:ankyrin repeat protein